MAIFPNLCLWRRSLYPNLGGIDPKKLFQATWTKLQMVWPYESFDDSAYRLPDGTEYPSYATKFWQRASPTRCHSESISGCHRLAADGAEWLLAPGRCVVSRKIDPNSRTRIYAPYPPLCGQSWECPPRCCNPLCRSGLPGKHRYICNNHCTMMNLSP